MHLPRKLLELRVISQVDTSKKKLLDEIYPGEIFPEEFMKPMGITARWLEQPWKCAKSRVASSANPYAARCKAK